VARVIVTDGVAADLDIERRLLADAGAELALARSGIGVDNVDLAAATRCDPWPQDIEKAPTAAAAVSEADAVSLHAPLTPETRHLVDAGLIAAMQRRPVLVNTARGGLVELAAVTAALDDGRLGGVALDVTEPEPLPADHLLRRHPRAIVTPHMAFSSVQAEEELRRRATGEIVRGLRGEPLERIVNDELARSVFLPGMLERGDGAVVTMASNGARARRACHGLVRGGQGRRRPAHAARRPSALA
jgi:phosphoglycerate dehydrogenase-like enzyme